MPTDNSGSFIKLHRKIEEWDWYQDGNTFRVFMHLLIRANYIDKTWRGILIKRGQLITSVDSLSEQLGLTTQNIRTALKHLGLTKELTIETTAHYSLITLSNYDKYQGTNKPANKQVTNSQQTPNKRLTTTKERKEVKERKETTTKNGLFLEFWESYPKKVGKGAAEKVWLRITDKQSVIEKIKNSLEWQKNSEQWSKEGGQYIPNPSTYLNQQRWEDEPPKKVERKKFIIQ